MVELNTIADKLLDMKPDPIPEFILLKEFKGLNPSSREYQNAYDRVCSHPFVKKIENAPKRTRVLAAFSWVLQRV